MTRANTKVRNIRGGSTGMTYRADDLSGVFQSVAAARRVGGVWLDLGGAVGARIAYNNGGLIARVVDMPADAATSRGVTVTEAGPDLYSELDRLGVLQALSDALRWSLLDGGGAIIIMARDGGTLDMPLREGSIQEIEELRVVALPDLVAMTDRPYDDPTQLNYGLPQWYEIRWGGRKPVEVHESRIIPVPGSPTTSAATADTSSVPWAGRGLGARVVEAIERYRRGVAWAEKLLERKQQAVHKMKGLGEMLMAGREDVVRARIDLVDSNRGNLNGVAVDGEDDYTILNADVTGVPAVLDAMQAAASAETGFPITILFGRSPGGLNATGDSDWAAFYEMVAGLQKRRLTPALERIVALIYAQTASAIESASIPDDWRIEWNPLAILNQQEQTDVDNKAADTLKKTADAVVAITGTGSVSTDEARAWLQEQRLFGQAPEDDGNAAAARTYAGET